MGGTIEIDSEVNIGTTFTLTKQTLMLDTILCIDDDAITLMLCKKVIIKSSFSHEIITAQNGEEALQYFEL
jgi:chemotaxis protein histidine kinase CheA